MRRRIDWRRAAGWCIAIPAVAYAVYVYYSNPVRQKPFADMEFNSYVKVDPWAKDRLTTLLPKERGLILVHPLACTVRELEGLRGRWRKDRGRHISVSQLSLVPPGLPVHGFSTEAESESDRRILERAGFEVTESDRKLPVTAMLRRVPADHWLLVAVQEGGLEGLTDPDRAALAALGLAPPDHGPYVGLGQRGWKRGLERCSDDGSASLTFDQDEELWPGGPRAPVPLVLISSEAAGWNARLRIGAFDAIRWRREYWNWATQDHHRGLWFAEIHAATGRLIQYFEACYFEGRLAVTVRTVRGVRPRGAGAAQGKQ